MSIKDRLAKKTEGLLVPGKTSAGAGQTPLKTGPGQMLMVNALMKETNEKVSVLEERLKEYEGSLPARLIDASLVRPSKWANRIEDSFGTAAFAELKAEIASAGGNVQPIKVRPVAGEGGRFEIIFGHRRHRACLELGLPVLAVVEAASDQDLFKEMDRENRARKDLAPWEQGVMYRRALQEKLFASQEQLANEVGVDPGNLSKALRLAELPEAIVRAFGSPLELQYRWAKPLSDALKANGSGVLERAALLAEKKHTLAGKEVLAKLIGAAVNPSAEGELLGEGDCQARVVFGTDHVTMRFSKGTLTEERQAMLRKLIEDFLSK